MKAIVINQSGGIEQLKLQEINQPKTPEGHVKIKTKAFGLNRAEVYFRSGSWGEITEPKIAGIEAVGEVFEDKTGLFEEGQKVITAMGGLMLARAGSYADYVIAPASNVLAVNTTLSWEELAAVPQAYLTIWGALDKCINIKPQQTLLVRGGTTTLGFAAITYAKARGLNVIATTRNPENRALLIEKGAAEVIIDKGNIAEEIHQIFPEGVDNAIDVIGATSIKDTLKTAKHWGQVCLVGVLTGTEIENFDLMANLPNTVKLNFFSSGLLGSAQLPFSESPIQWIINQIESKNMPSILSNIYKFDEIREAHSAMENNKINGKAVVSI